ncbi:hypothetical protein A3734_06835 [Sulfitobacter sp. HI0054]|nr:hypothetical protein A3734_06835 [Sulfitobacter sp. HI0054]
MGTSTLNVRIRRAERLVAKLEAALADPNLSPARRETAQLALRGAQHLLDKRKAQQRAIGAVPEKSLHPR